jgi:hypothetical protein
MWNHGIPKGREDSGIRNEFTDEILDIYKQAATELIQKDEEVFKELLDSGKITKEQYDGLRLGKVTTGLGYSNIKGSFETLELDKSGLSRPLKFEEPVKLHSGLYTNDSNTQYILEKREDRKEFDGDTLAIHSDSYIEYDDSNFTKKLLYSLKKLEILTKGYNNYMEFDSGNDNSNRLVSEIAMNYGFNPKTTRIIMNPNFAIIYDINKDNLIIGDLLFNTKVDNGKQQIDIENQVVMQIRLALEQIAGDKKIEVCALDKSQKEMYDKVVGLTNEMDIERGINHAR